MPRPTTVPSCPQLCGYALGTGQHGTDRSAQPAPKELTPGGAWGCTHCTRSTPPSKSLLCCHMATQCWMPDEVLCSVSQYSLQWRVQCWVHCSLQWSVLFYSAACSGVCSTGCIGVCSALFCFFKTACWVIFQTVLNYSAVQPLVQCAVQRAVVHVCAGLHSRRWQNPHLLLCNAVLLSDSGLFCVRFCCVVLCFAVLCDVVLCCAVLWWVMPCLVGVCLVVQCCDLL